MKVEIYAKMVSNDSITIHTIHVDSYTLLFSPSMIRTMQSRIFF